MYCLTLYACYLLILSVAYKSSHSYQNNSMKSFSYRILLKLGVSYWVKTCL